MSSQPARSQSWTAWLLDSYASSVQQDINEVPQDTAQQSTTDGSPISNPSQSSTSGSMASSSSSSPYGPYLRTGRGGAGNFHWDPQTDSQNPDLESQQQSSLSERRKAAGKLERLETGEAMQNRRLSAQYLHVGRGGAANYAQSNEVQTVQSPRSPFSPSSRSISLGSGRGGAGNLNSTMETKAREEQDELEKERSDAERRREQVEEQVDVMLQPPPGAVLSGSKRSSVLLESG